MKQYLLSTSCFLPFMVLLLGVSIMGYGIIVEDEPTAIGLATSLIGSVWLINRCHRQKQHPTSMK